MESQRWVTFSPTDPGFPIPPGGPCGPSAPDDPDGPLGPGGPGGPFEGGEETEQWHFSLDRSLGVGVPQVPQVKPESRQPYSSLELPCQWTMEATQVKPKDGWLSRRGAEHQPAPGQSIGWVRHRHWPKGRKGGAGSQFPQKGIPSLTCYCREVLPSATITLAWCKGGP